MTEATQELAIEILAESYSPIATLFAGDWWWSARSFDEILEAAQLGLRETHDTLVEMIEAGVLRTYTERDDEADHLVRYYEVNFPS
jgi:transcription initiation factor IIE alpha subunit